MGILTIGVPDAEHAQQLVDALEDRWACCASDSYELPMTVVFLSPHNVSDFAHLVRRVQAWLTERSLGAIAFELRGRGHIHGSSTS
jgi:hypothetical protein